MSTAHLFKASLAFTRAGKISKFTCLNIKGGGGRGVSKWAYFCLQSSSNFICLMSNMSTLLCYTGLRAESPIFCDTGN